MTWKRKPGDSKQLTFVSCFVLSGPMRGRNEVIDFLPSLSSQRDTPLSAKSQLTLCTSSRTLLSDVSRHMTGSCCSSPPQRPSGEGTFQYGTFQKYPYMKVRNQEPRHPGSSVDVRYSCHCQLPCIA
eukprot:2604670-Rhodomonas_salina.2